MFTLAPGEKGARPSPCSVPCWDLLRPSHQGELDSPLPLRHILFSCVPKDEPGAWSLPAPIRADFPRQSVPVPEDACASAGLATRWVKSSGLLLPGQEIEALLDTAC